MPIKMRCATCIWWQPAGPKLASAARDPAASEEVGTCQIDPPIVMPTEAFVISVFPETHADRFCSSWAEIDDQPGRPSTGGPKASHLRSVS